jgi:hypothetical protein
MEIIFGKITKLIPPPTPINITEKRNSSGELLVSPNRKVKEIPPSPFYDGKYHPPIISSTGATLANILCAGKGLLEI